MAIGRFPKTNDRFHYKIPLSCEVDDLPVLFSTDDNGRPPTKDTVYCLKRFYSRHVLLTKQPQTL